MALTCTENQKPKERPSTAYLIDTLTTKTSYVLSDKHVEFMANFYQAYESSPYSQAKDNNEWRDAMSKEIQTLKENNTWNITNLPRGKRAIRSRWVYKIKYQPNGKVERYKARLVSKGWTTMTPLPQLLS